VVLYNEIKEQRGMYNPMPMIYSADAQMIPGFKEGVFKMTKGEKHFICSFTFWHMENKVVDQ
jgi:hypothetical protein